MLGLLAKRGYLFTDDETEAEIAVVNTCCFVNDAKEESIQSLLEMAELKKTGRLVLLVAAGCLAQRYQEEIREEIPEVDMILGTTAIDKSRMLSTVHCQENRRTIFRISTYRYRGTEANV